MFVAAIVMTRPGSSTLQMLSAFFFLAGLFLVIVYAPMYIGGKLFGTERKRSGSTGAAGGGAGGSVDDDWPVRDDESHGIKERQVMHDAVFGSDAGDDGDDDSRF
jgi:hypothetical protein